MVVAKSVTDSSDATSTIDAYLDTVPEPFRGALVALRALIRSADPEAEEDMVYGVPGFRHDGPLVCYAAFKAHCGFYPMSPELMDSMVDELAGFRTAKGTIQFTPDRPLPDALVRKIVAARVEQNAAKRRKR